MIANLELCKCEDCPLKGRTKVLGEGSSNKPGLRDVKTAAEKLGGKELDEYEVVFVGIAPAYNEVIQGRPLVGWSGQVLRAIAAKFGYTSFYLMNTLLCELKEGDDENLAAECCKDRLFAEIQAVKPRLTIVLGNLPLRVLTGKNVGIKSVEGRVLPGLLGYVLPIIHPAALRRRPDEFPDFVDAMGAGKRWLSGTYQQAIDPELVLVTEDNFAEVLQRIENAELVSVDLETTNRCYYPYGREPDGIRCIMLAVDTKTAYVVPGNSSPHFEKHPDLSRDPRLIEVLDKSKCLFHNGQFDCGFLWQAGYRTKIFYDTFLAHYMLDERQYTHGLKRLAAKYLGASDWEGDLIKKYLPNKISSFDLIPDDVLYYYAAYDVTYTYQIYERMKKEVSGGIYRDLIIPCTNMFVDLRHRGLPIDISALVDMDSELEAELERAKRELQEMCGYSLNPLSSKEVASLLYDEMKILSEGAKGGFGRHGMMMQGRTTDHRVLESHRHVPIVDKILECRELNKLVSTYVQGIAEFVDWKIQIHPELRLWGTVTGRLSSRFPSVMNIPRGGATKSMFIPTPGHLILETDQKQMELKCYAIIANDEYCKELLRLAITDPTMDPHTIVGIETTRRCGREIDRIVAKGGVFGRMYGRGLQSFMYSFNLSKHDAEELISVIDAIFPSIWEYNKQVQRTIHERGYLESYFGRKRRFGLILDENKHELYRQGANFGIQSMASDINLFSMLHMYNERERFGAIPLFPVHDSIVFDVESEDTVGPIVKELTSYCKELVGGAIDFTVDAKVGRNWRDVRSWNAD